LGKWGRPGCVSTGVKKKQKKKNTDSKQGHRGGVKGEDYNRDIKLLKKFLFDGSGGTTNLRSGEDKGCDRNRYKTTLRS